MAIAHVCIQCGLDLARVRPQSRRDDPYYGLPLVICRRCGHSAVRRKHPLQQKWRHLRRLFLALLVIGLQIAAAQVAGAATIAFVVGAASEEFEIPHDQDVQYAIAAAFVAIALFTGAWLTVGFRHLRWYFVWPGWTLLMMCFLFIITFNIAYVGRGGGLGISFGTMAFAERLQYATLELFLPMASAVLLIMIAATAGIIPGRICLWFLNLIRSAYWRWRRRRLRAIRSGS